ncbi:oligosaccharide flippase family protein, partial [Microvirga sp. 3-52]|nr:oligosaccharide flippase family protein [Microvirga sp. 3-52]
FFLAEPIAHLVIRDEEQIFSIEQITSVIRWVSYALLVVPLMSIVRGFLQGYNKMEPTAISQLVEQIVRIIAVLIGAYFVVNFMHESPEKAINFAVFAAFIGGIAGLGVL